MGHAPLLAAIKKIAEDLGSNPQLALPSTQVSHPTVVILDYRRDENTFRTLWALDENGVPLTQPGNDLLANLGNRQLKIILVDTDDATVIAPDRFGKHVAAIDWAYSFYYALALQDKHFPEIAVLDLRNLGSVRAASSVYNDVEGIRYFDRSYKSIESFGSWLEGINQSIDCISPDKDALQSKFRQWTVNLASANSRSGHHDLNNSLGPLSLAASCPDEVKSAVIEARRTLVGGKEDSRQVTAAAALIRAFEWFSPSKPISLESVSWKEIFKQARYDENDEIRILLLDDQAMEGWMPVLAHFLGLPLPVKHINWNESKITFQQYTKNLEATGSPKISLWVATSLSSLANSLNIPKRTIPGLPQQLCLTDNNQVDFTEILFLDLRLFPENASEEELNILSLFQKYFGKAHQKDILSRSTNMYLEGLTLPAKALSTRDFSYPIVIWSTTGQRSVTQELSEYKNIHTRLQKPRFDHYFENSLNEFAFDIHEALCSSLLVTSSRKSVENIAAIPSRLNSIREHLTKNHVLVEVYIDESSKYKDVNKWSPFTIGGLMIIYSGNTSEECELVAEEFKKVIKDERVFIEVSARRSPTGIEGTIECVLEGQQNLEEKNADMRERVSEQFKKDIQDEVVLIDASASTSPTDKEETIACVLEGQQNLEEEYADLRDKIANPSACVYKLAKFDKFHTIENTDGKFYPINSRSIGQAIGKQLPPGSVMIPFTAETPDSIVTPFEHTQIDGKYYESVPLVLEALLADIVGDIKDGFINSINYKVKVHIAARQKELIMDLTNIEQFKENWATVFKNKKGKNLYSSVTDAWVHSTLWLICKDRIKSFHNKSLVSAIADNYSNKMDGLYFLTDNVPTHHAFMSYIFENLKAVYSLKEDLGNRRLSISIAASRLLDHGKLPDAALLAEQAFKIGIQNNNTETLSSAVLCRIGERLLSKLDKDSFYRLLRLRS